MKSAFVIFLMQKRTFYLFIICRFQSIFFPLNLRPIKIYEFNKSPISSKTLINNEIEKETHFKIINEQNQNTFFELLSLEL